jgi:hypothetical protein
MPSAPWPTGSDSPQPCKPGTPTGLKVRHSRPCLRASGGTGEPCRCKPGPSWEAFVWSRREQRKITKTFSGRGAFSAAKAWREDSLHANRKGTLKRATRRTVREAAEELIRGMEDGSVRSNRRKPYKPSTIRSYKEAGGLRAL